MPVISSERLDRSGEDDEFRGAEEANSFTTAYKVTTDGTPIELHDIVVEAIANNFLPDVGEQFDLGSGAQYRARTIPGGRWIASGEGSQQIYEFQVEWDNQPTQIQSLDQGTQQQPPSQIDPADPELDVPIVTRDTQTVQQPSAFDFRGAVAANTAGDQLDPVPSLTYTMLTISIEYNRENRDDYTDLVGSTNQVAIEIEGERYEALTGFCRSFRAVGPQYRYYKPSGGAKTVTQFYRHSVVFELLMVPRPTGVTLLDPVQVIKNPGVPKTMGVFEDPATPGVQATYLPHAEIKANVGLNAVFAYTPYSPAVNYAVGSRVLWTDTNNYQAKEDNGPDTAAGVQDPTQAQYWSTLAPDTVDFEKLHKRRILRGDVEDLDQLAVDFEDAKLPVDQPYYLDQEGKLLTERGPGKTIFALVLMNKKERDWSQFPGITNAP